MKKFFSRQLLKGSQSMTRRLCLGSLIASSLIFKKSINCDQLEEEQSYLEALKQKQTMEQNNKKLIQYDVGSSKLVQEGEIYPFIIKNEDKDYKIVIIRQDDKLYSVSGRCTYDGETDLSDGICFGNKLYCPKHGCQYDITNGFVEQGPAKDNLPKFIVEERDKQIMIHSPAKVPRKVLPYMFYRDHNDLRKVVVLGWEAGYACAQTLREFSYSGQLIMVSEDPYLPYDKLQLTKKIKDTSPDDFFIRTEDWYKDQQIEVVNGREIKLVHKKQYNNYVELEDGMRFEYDGLLVATGLKGIHKSIPGLQANRNTHYIDTLADHQKFKEALDTTKKLTVIGINWDSLETVATVRREYPHIDVTMIDPNKENFVKAFFGRDVNQKILDLHRTNNVQIIENTRIKKVEDKNNKIDSLLLSNGRSVEADTLLFCPNNGIPNTSFLNDFNETIEFDFSGHVQTDHFCRSSVKRIFAAGGSASQQYFFTADRYVGLDPITAFQQGVVAAYNIMALNVPLHYIPYRFTEQYGKVLQRTGSWSKYDNTYVIGDIDGWDFIVLYSWNDNLVGALGTQSNQNYVNIINEILRLQVSPHLSEFIYGKVNIENLERFIRNSKRSGCFKGLVMNEKDKPVDKNLIWQYREDWATYFDMRYDDFKTEHKTQTYKPAE